MTPVMGAQLSLPSINVPTVANVTLAGLDSPISELLGSLILGGQLLLNTDTEWGQVPTANPPFAGNANPKAWGPSAFGSLDANGNFVPYAGADLTMYGLVGSGLYNGLGVGVLPQIIDDALPIIRQLGINGSDYLNATVAGLSGAGIALSEGVWNAAGELLTLNIPGALSTLTTSIGQAGSLALATGAYVLANVVNRLQAVAGVVLGSLPDLITATLAQIGTVVGSIGAVVQNTIAAGTFEGGWNAAVDGIFGATGVPGTIMNVTIGAGQFVQPNTADQAFVPSVRTVVRTAVLGISDALATPLPAAAAAAPAAAAKKAARSAASVRSTPAEAAAPAAEAAAPAAEAAAGDSDAVAASSAPAEKKASPRAARKAARAAS
jgi:hypothetical protein